VTTFLQLHLLTSYPPANLNRDDAGQPKTARMGGATRARVSSQSLKRAWRTSDIFAEALAGHIGTRTKRLAEDLMRRLIAAGKDEKVARETASAVAARIAKVDNDHPPQTGQLVFLSPTELAAIGALSARLVAGEEVDLAAEPLLGGADSAADIAMFGRSWPTGPSMPSRPPSRWPTR
jgi:CRISPR system Cascade subunit CasC